MEFSLANAGDTGEIVDLLKLALGEGSTPKTEAFWNWKHHYNPFGASLVLLARQNNTLIGVRAFMHWQFENESNQITCARAVDTAVHPNYRGAGIFTKLTLAALEASQQNGVQLIYNTPNAKSKGGYLKMGWQENGKMPLRMAIPLQLPRKFDALYVQEVSSKFPVQHFNRSFLGCVNGVKSNVFQTPLTYNYLHWRYLDCPLSDYGFIGEIDSFFIFFKLKKIGNYTELRVCDCAVHPSIIHVQEAVKALKRLIKVVRPLVVSCATSSSIPAKFFQQNYFLPTLPVGPITTLRTLETPHFASFFKFNAWQPSLGCMELF